MSNDLDEVSLALGRIEATQTVIMHTVRETSVSIENLKEKQYETDNSLGKYKAELESLQKDLTTNIKPALDDINKLKQRGIGVLVLFGLFSASASSVIHKFIKQLFGA